MLPLPLAQLTPLLFVPTLPAPASLVHPVTVIGRTDSYLGSIVSYSSRLPSDFVSQLWVKTEVNKDFVSLTGGKQRRTRKLRYMGHFDGTDPMPNFGLLPLTQAQVEELVQWDCTENTLNALLMQKVSDLIVIIIDSIATSKCPASANVCEFLKNLTIHHETLTTLGFIISEDDFRSTIITCLPKYLAGFTSMQLTFAKLYSSTCCLRSIHTCYLSEEYNCKAAELKKHDRKGKDHGDEVIKGHLSRDCRKPKKSNEGKEAKPPASAPKVGGSTAVVDFNSEGAWAVNVDSDYGRRELRGSI
ncbi:hypothetical protein K438DRAFT_1746730 [Mycena galopus ATCC 62051]|nr:hypothetical protein K438DRAFT_1746730 [Mycena galopus ATCC 62051]